MATAINQLRIRGSMHVLRDSGYLSIRTLNETRVTLSSVSVGLWGRIGPLLYRQDRDALDDTLSACIIHSADITKPGERVCFICQVEDTLVISFLNRHLPDMLRLLGDELVCVDDMTEAPITCDSGVELGPKEINDLRLSLRPRRLGVSI